MLHIKNADEFEWTVTNPLDGGTGTSLIDVRLSQAFVGLQGREETQRAEW